jgi:hypothetical protein
MPMATDLRATNGGRANIRSARGEPGLRSTACPESSRHRWRARLSGRCATAGRGKPGLRTWVPPTSRASPLTPRPVVAVGPR